MESNIYISSLAFLGKPVEEIIEICKNNNYNLEFSSGMPFNKSMTEIYLSTSIRRQPHNYFPDSEIPFVLNLASENSEIRNKSIDHCIKGLKLAKQSNSPFYAAHAGFCIDPNPNELGQKIVIRNKFKKESNKKHFVNSILDILEIAKELDIDFLIENNVLAPFNYDGKNNPLLCCDFKDIFWLFNTIKHEKFGLLLDTAHLKVSCKTLTLDLLEEFKNISPFIKAFHHSDNDGTIDNNLKLTNKYWFLDYLKDFQDYVHVLEIKSLSILDIEKQIKLIQKNGATRFNN